MSAEDDYAEAQRRIAAAKDSGATELDLNGLDDLEQFPPEIADLTGLQILLAWGTKISDLSPLQGLTALQGLDLNNTQVSDISPLQGLTALQVLSLSNTQVSDISPLQGLTALQSLNLSFTQISDISPLQGLTAVQSLGLINTQISDISPLRGLTAVQTLGLNSTQVSDISPLQGLTALQILSLSSTQVSDISPLQGLTALQTLDFTSTQVSDISPLQGLTALQDLYLSRTQIVDLRPLRDLSFDIQTKLGVSGLQIKRSVSGLSFQDTPATRADPELARLSEIKEDNNRTQQTLAYLRSLPAPPAPLPWQVPDVALEDRLPDPPAPDAVPRIRWTGDQIDVDHTLLSEQDITDPIKRRMFDRLQKTLEDLKRIGNRHPEVAGPARRLGDACANGFESADLLDIHIEVATLTDIVASNDARSDAERIDEEDLDIIRKTTRLGPPLTLGNPDVDLFEQRNADYANLRRPETVPHAERLVAEALDKDAPMTPRAHELIQRAANADDESRLASYRSSLVKNNLLRGVGFVAATMTAGYLGQFGVEGATWSLEFFVAHKDAIITVAASWGDQGYVWAADMIQRSQEILRIIKNQPPKT
ncbi:leucine-rich repeat domain-containing protein [Phaeobacter marinintestinus]|uniref:leucine-rich repeat domain-containing protein n=1 Tax=Falsiphaeobacter marinintestinus TaxID=1492905 RepID=UPI0011B7E757|nr:leucine-rich repeat domain-containing protein [Phaeobacter marinintestinus]